MGDAKKIIDFTDYVGGESVLREAGTAVRKLDKDISALAKSAEADSARIKTALEQIKTAAAGLQKSGSLLNVGTNGADAKALNDLVAQVRELEKARAQLQKEEAANIATQKALADAAKGVSSALKEQQTAFKTAVAAGDNEAAKRAAVALRSIKTEATEASRAVRGGASAYSAAVGSVDELRLKLSAGTAAWAAMSAAERENSAAGKALVISNKALSTELKNLENSIGDSRRRIGEYSSAFQSAGAGAFSFLKQVGGGLVGVQLAAQTAQSVLASFASASEFKSALSSLSALTGATGEDLDFLAQKAEELGPAVGKSAAETLKAFELIGSAKPELLSNAKALADFTEQALLLAAASGEELPAAADALTSVMNQFQAPAEEAARYVNALAAGAKEGAATIPQSANALKYFGVNAATANVSVEKSVALIQTLAERGIKGEQAGTQLRNVLAKLASGAKATNPEIVGLDKALENLGKQNLSTAQYTKLFGLENANTGRVLVESRDKVKLLTAAVTGTSVANEQAGRQLDNFATSSNRFFATLKNGAINSLGPLLTGFGHFLDQLSALASKLNGTTRSAEQNTAATLAGAQANEAVISSSELLLKRYDELTAKTKELTAKGEKPSAESKKELSAITLQLRDSLGESVTSIDAETHSLVLNEEAARAVIKQKILLSNQAVTTLILEADALKEKGKAAYDETEQLRQQIATREQLLGISAKEAARRVQEFAESSVDGKLDAGTAAADKLYKQSLDLEGAQRRLVQATIDYNGKLDALDKLGAKGSYLAGDFADATTKSADALKKVPPATDAARKGIADVLKAELELQKFRLEQQAKGYDRQAENVANTDEIRTRAVEKAADARRQIAKLDELEAIHQAELKNAKLIDGDKALAKERLLITEQYNAKIQELDFNGKRAIVALKQATADQLAEIDKQQLDTEAKALEAIGADENRNAAERQQALLDASARRIEIIQIESEAKRRAAKGDAEVLRKIQAEEAAATEAELKKTRNPNADLANNDLAAKYLVAQLALEKSRQAGLFTERQYNREVIRLEDAYLAKKLENLKKDSTKQQEAAELEVFINKRKNDQKAKDDEDARNKRQELTREVAQGIDIIESTYAGFRQQRLDAQQDALQRSYEQDVRNAGENQELKQVLADEFDKKQRELKRKQAILDRDNALFQIAISTAVNAAQYTPINPLFYLALVSGAAQAALVLSKPIPQFFKGVRNLSADIPLATVSEQGPEIIHRKKENQFEYVAKPSYTSLALGDSVFTAPETTRIMADAHRRTQELQQPLSFGRGLESATAAIQAGRAPVVEEGGRWADVKKALDANTAAIKKIKQVTVNVNGEVTGAIVQRGDALSRSLNKRLLDYGG